jgi:tetratricopeptide (TPR) repeat protein
MAYVGTSKPVPQIARELNVDAVLESSVRREGDSVHVRVQLIQARPLEKTVWSGRYDKHVRDVLKLYGEVAQAVAREVDATLSGEQTARLATIRQVNPATYESYVKAMYYLDQGTQDGATRGLAYLREAIDRDPGDPLAWAGLAVGYITAAHGPAPPMDALPLARAAADRALKLDSSLTETMAALAFLRGYYDWEWADAERLYHRALERNPSSAMAHYWYAWQLYLFDQLDSAIAEHIRAREADPLNPLHTAWLGELYVYQGRYVEAMEEAQRAIDLMPGYPVSYYVISNAQSTQGRHEEAIAAARQAVAADPEWKFVLGLAFARAGREAEARQVLAELQAARTTPWVAISLVIVHAALGDKDEAFRWLNYEHPHAWVPWVRVAPWFSRLWDDPRFPPLLERMHLPPRQSAGPARVDR